jgi:enoyl-CoA hydratase
MFTAKEAMDYGMVNKVVPAGELLSRTKEILEVIQSKSPVAVGKVIECVTIFDHTQKGYEFEIRKFGECFNTQDMLEGTTAFLEKRKPDFKGN